MYLFNYTAYVIFDNNDSVNYLYIQGKPAKKAKIESKENESSDNEVEEEEEEEEEEDSPEDDDDDEVQSAGGSIRWGGWRVDRLLKVGDS